jgi:hypothetical protein
MTNFYLNLSLIRCIIEGGEGEGEGEGVGECEGKSDGGSITSLFIHPRQNLVEYIRLNYIVYYRNF